MTELSMTCVFCATQSRQSAMCTWLHVFAGDRRLQVQNLDKEALRKCTTGFEVLLVAFPLGG
jgi:hypothetical protein